MLKYSEIFAFHFPEDCIISNFLWSVYTNSFEFAKYLTSITTLIIHNSCFLISWKVLKEFSCFFVFSHQNQIIFELKN